MKLLVLSIVLVGLIGASKQQNAAAVRPFVLFNRPHYMPLFYANGVPAGYDVIGSNNQVLTILKHLLKYFIKLKNQLKFDSKSSAM